MKKPFHLATPEEIDALVASATMQAAQESLQLGVASENGKNRTLSVH